MHAGKLRAWDFEFAWATAGCNYEVVVVETLCISGSDLMTVPVDGDNPRSEMN